MKNLKALSAAALAVALTLSLAACSSNEGATSEDTTVDSTVVEDAADEAQGNAAALGFGLIASADDSDNGEAAANTTVAAVLVDEAGVIVDVKIDVAQCKVTSEGGVFSTPEAYLTKTELGDDYGMGGFSSLEEGEWYQQQAAFMSYLIGMTAADVASIGYDETNYPTDEDLLATCTIKIADYVGAVLLAMENATEYTCTVEDTLSLAFSSEAGTASDAGTDEAGAPTEGSIALATTVAALVVSPEGVVNDLYLDVTQPSFTNTAEDVITGAGEVLSKQQKLDDYGMAGFSSLEAGEWYQQAAAFKAYVVGMNAAELGSIEYDEAFHAVDEDLLATCTIKINSYVDILVKAAG